MSTPFSAFEPARDPRRILAIAVVAALHVGLVYGLLEWGVRRAEVQLERAPVQVALIDEKMDDSQELRPPPPKLTVPEVVIELPAIDLPQYADAPSTISVAYRTESNSKPPASAPLPKMVSTVEYLRPLRPRYPPTSRRLKEEGLVVLLVLVNEEGRPARVEVRDSSGFKRLDHAAREAVECAQFKPYVEDGIPQPALVLIPVEFTLNQRVAQR